MYFKVTGKQAPILHVNEKPNQEEKQEVQRNQDCANVCTGRETGEKKRI